jgi:hypothetical protein
MICAVVLNVRAQPGTERLYQSADRFAPRGSAGIEVEDATTAGVETRGETRTDPKQG